MINFKKVCAVWDSYRGPWPADSERIKIPIPLKVSPQYVPALKIEPVESYIEYERIKAPDEHWVIISNGIIVSPLHMRGARVAK